jgi:hypothetical protein
VNGLSGVQPPAGTSNFVLALVLLLTLILRPNGITGGREIPWPGDWSLAAVKRAPSRVLRRGGSIESPAPPVEVPEVPEQAAGSAE